CTSVGEWICPLAPADLRHSVSPSDPCEGQHPSPDNPYWSYCLIDLEWLKSDLVILLSVAVSYIQRLASGSLLIPGCVELGVLRMATVDNTVLNSLSSLNALAGKISPQSTTNTGETNANNTQQQQNGKKYSYKLVETK
ncbi:unnamed protein product, partial [Meganyctiphanes norvegica]